MNTTSPSKSYLPVLAIFLCCLVWGTTFVIVKDAMTDIDPFLLSAFRNLLAVIVLFIFLILTKKIGVLKIKNGVKYGSVLGILLGAIYSIQSTGLIYTTSNHSAFISCSAVVMVPIFMYFVGWQKFNLKQIFAIIVITTGLFLLTFKPGLIHFNQGDFFTFIAAVICAIHLILSGHYVRKIDFLPLIFYQFLFATIGSFFGLFIKYIINHQEPILFNNSVIPNVLYLGLLGTLFCYFVTVWGQKQVSTVYTALIFSLEPIFASIVSYIVLGEVFTQHEIIGAISIFIGVVYYSIPKNLTKVTYYKIKKLISIN